MRLVNSLMTEIRINEEQINEIKKIIQSEFHNKIEIYQYDYADYNYKEVDFDIFDVIFTEETIYEDINKLISVYERIIKLLPFSVDFIAGNDDTDAEVQCYQKDWNDIAKIGLFVTKRSIEKITPYYHSFVCNAYINTEWFKKSCMQCFEE